MKLAFIVQRYGTEILGGSEYHCRLIAERLALRHEVEVLTTCAQDYVTWKNAYPEGEDRVRGVTVRRFANSETRDIKEFNKFSDWIFHNPHTDDDEVEWLRRQGPWCPALIKYLEQYATTYDALIFFTYLYAPTVLGLRVAPSRSILVPTAHDEPAIQLKIYRDMFTLPAGIAYNTAVERQFLKSNFTIRAVSEEIVGCGVDLPQLQGYRKRTTTTPTSTSSTNVSQELEGKTKLGQGDHNRPQALQTGNEAFRRRYRLHGPIVLYGGRIDPGKGCEELIEYFGSYREDGGDATLTLMGAKLMPLPEEPFIRFAGLLPDRERVQALEAATVVVVPSPLESLSLLALESFAVGTPILANARSDVLVSHCRQSNAGLYYADRDEFVECLKLLLLDKRLRTAMGIQGRNYVRRNYRWDVILGIYERMIATVRGPSLSTANKRQRDSSGRRQ